MIERRALERIEIDQPAMLHLDGVCGIYPCVVMNFHDHGAKLHSFTFHIVAFEFDLSFDGSKRQSTAMWCGGTGIHAASNLSIAATPERRVEGAQFKYADIIDQFIPIAKISTSIRSSAFRTEGRRFDFTDLDRL